MRDTQVMVESPPWSSITPRTWDFGNERSLRPARRGAGRPCGWHWSGGSTGSAWTTSRPPPASRPAPTTTTSPAGKRRSARPPPSGRGRSARRSPIAPGLTPSATWSRGCWPSWSPAPPGSPPCTGCAPTWTPPSPASPRPRCAWWSRRRPKQSPPAPPHHRGRQRADPSPAHLPPPLPRADHPGGRPAAHPDPGHPLPPDPQRRHHRQRRRPGRHRLHPAHRRRDGRGHAGADPRFHRRRLLRRPDGHGRRARPAPGDLRPGAGLLHQRGRPLRHAVADHPDHQRRPAGPDAGAADLHADGVGADHGHRRRAAGTRPGRAAVLAAAGDRAGVSLGGGAHHLAHAPAVPADAGAPGPDQPGAPRADQRRPRDPRLRPRPQRARAVRDRQHRADVRLARRRAADGADVPHRPAGDERLQRGRAVVRRPPRRQRRDADRRLDGVPQLPGPDPDLRDDGDLHVRDGAARRGLRRAHPGGTGHQLQRGPAPEPGATRTAERPAGLRGVEFHYPGAEKAVLRGVDLVARPGEVTAVIGSTGSGKTTLLDLVPRLFDATAGSVLVDGVDVRQLDPQTLSATVDLVPQRPYLFSGTVASNLRYGNPDATDEALWRALEIAQARDFVERMPEGLDASIAQGGTNVSGGQRQRLAIARALVHRPSVYLFDDSFSALDYATDAALRAALARETTGATVVIVAQRVATIRHADTIVVLDDGRVVGTGTHRQLMESNQTYREIVLSQLTEQEAA